MLQLVIVISEDYDEEKRQFISAKTVTLQLEHSLLSMSKWEAKWEKPFLGYDKKTEEETLDYVRMMVLGPLPSEEDFSRLSAENLLAVQRYIEAPMSATWFSEEPSNMPSREAITSELIYFWMTAFGIPFTCENWHLNRLMNLVRICNIKNGPKKKMSAQASAAEQRALNERRRRELGTKG